MKTIYLVHVDGGPNSEAKQRLLSGLARETRRASEEMGLKVEVEILDGPNILSRKLGISTAEVHSVCLVGQAAFTVAQEMLREFRGVKFVSVVIRKTPDVDMEELRRFMGRTPRGRKEFLI
jgi:hypothetical protein